MDKETISSVSSPGSPGLNWWQSLGRSQDGVMQKTSSLLALSAAGCMSPLGDGSLLFPFVHILTHALGLGGLRYSRQV